jgi:hypothetical protein
MTDFETLKKWVTKSWRNQSQWREGARDNYGFAAGSSQWTTEEENYLAETNRVPITFNRTATIINAVAGSEINNRTEVRFFPREIGDSKPNEMFTAAAEWFRDQGGAEEEESQSFYDTLVCGMGWTETRLDFEADTEGEPSIERISPLEMGWDCSASRRGLVDTRYRFRVREIPKIDAADMFGEDDREKLDALWLDGKDDGHVNTSHAGDDYALGDGHVADQTNMVRVVQIQWREKVKRVEYIDPLTGEKGELPKDQFDRVAKLIGIDKVRHRVVSKHEYHQAFLGNVELARSQPCKDAFTLNPVTGYYDEKEKTWYGLLESMKDPQKFANKWLTQTLHIINSNAKGGVMAERNAVDDIQEFEESWAKADGITWLNSGAIAQGQIQPKPQAAFPAGMMNLTEFAIMSIRDASGVNQELLGLRDQNQPGILEYQRKQSAMTTLAQLFDALRLYRKHQGKVLLYYIQEHLADGRLVRITGDQNDIRYLPLIADENATKYDVIIDDAPTAPNNKERVWETVMNMMPVLTSTELSPEVWAEIIEYSPFPSALTEAIKKSLTQPAGEPEDPLAGLKEIEFGKAKIKAQADIMRDTMRHRADAQRDMQKGESQQQELARKIAEIGASSELQREKMYLDSDTQRDIAALRAMVDLRTSEQAGEQSADMEILRAQLQPPQYPQ